jgi:peptidoglycan-associated lipoprotein
MFAVVGLLVGCASTPEEQKPAPSTEIKPSTGDVKPIKPTPTQPDLAGKGAQTQKVGVDPLNDPSNILSRRSIHFDYDQFTVKEEYKPVVSAHARYLQQNRNARVTIQGNTDERGSREYNVSLGQRRSDGVKKMMVLLGARENQIESVSLGEEKPQAEGQSEDAWSKNRRSDILYGGEY